MAEKIVPDVEFFAQEILSESQLDLPTQRLKLVERLMNFPVDKISEVPFEEWYRNYWKFVSFAPHIVDSPEKVESVCQQILNFTKRINNPLKDQFAALALLLFGKIPEAQALIKPALLSNKLREDLSTFLNFHRLMNVSNDLNHRAGIARNQFIKRFLENKYTRLIKKYQQFEVNDKTCPPVAQEDYKIYYCWLQGEENLIPLARCCYDSLKMNCGGYKICFIDENNYSDYVDIPEHIIKKFLGGGISRTHFSDILRVNLLERYGGLWIDATVLVTDSLDNHKNFWQMPYFTQKHFAERSNEDFWSINISHGIWSDFLQGTAILHNPLFAFIKDLFFEYLLEYDEFLDYFLMDFAMNLAYDNIPFVRQEIDAVPLNNPNIIALLYKLNEPYAQFPYDKILADTFFYKLVYKLPLDLQKPDTVFREIQRRYSPETIGQF